MSNSKRKPKLKQRAFHVWRPNRRTQEPDKRRCRHVVRRPNGSTAQCPNKVHVVFTDEETGDKLGSCMDHNPYAVGKLSPKKSRDRLLTGSVAAYHKRLEQRREELADAAIAWARSGYERKAAEKMRKAADRYLKHEAKGEPK
jgi:hypothetical protein